MLRYNFLDLGPRITDTDARSSRLIAGVEGRHAAWDLAASAGYTQVLLDLASRNWVDPLNLQAALNSTTEPYLVGGPNSAAAVEFHCAHAHCPPHLETELHPHGGRA